MFLTLIYKIITLFYFLYICLYFFLLNVNNNNPWKSRLMLISKLLDGHSIHCWLDRVNSAPTSVSRPSSLLKQQQFHFHSLPCPGYCFCTRRRTLRVVLVSVSRLCSWPIMSPIYPKNSVSNCVLHCWQNLVQQFGR